jgi:hypothetical protein
MQAAVPAAAPIAAPMAAPTAAPASPNYVPPPTPAPAPMATMEDGGSIGGSSGGNKFTEFFSDINILDVAISAFIVGGVLYAIHYYKFMMMMEKTGYADLNARIQKVESQVAAAKKNAELNATGNGMRKKRALVSL